MKCFYGKIHDLDQSVFSIYFLIKSGKSHKCFFNASSTRINEAKTKARENEKKEREEIIF